MLGQFSSFSFTDSLFLRRRELIYIIIIIIKIQDILKIYRGGGGRGKDGKGGSGDCVEGEVTWFLGGNV